MKKVFLFPLLAFLITQGMTAQVKLGDNPQSIDPASLFELESTDQVLVITRVSSAELQAITPSMGALAYNTDEKCLFYHNGEVWVNLCDALGRSFTTDAVQNEFPTIVITPLEESVNFEVGEIRSENIVDFSIGSQDIQNNSINSDKLADASVGAAELQDNAVTGRNLDFVDITLSDFVNDVPFLVEGTLVAAAIFYDNTASGLAGSDIQAAIDALSSGLNDVDLRAVGDGTYVFTDSDGTTTTFDLNASALRFDNTSNGFTATSVQGAIEEIQGSSSDDQEIIDFAFNETRDELTLTLEDGGTRITDLGALNQSASEVPVTSNPLNYAPETADVEGHLSGIDAALIAASGGNPNDELNLTFEVNGSNLELTDNGGILQVPLADLQSDNQTAAQVDVSAIPVNYNPLSADVEGHLAGIDEALINTGSGEIPDNELITDFQLTGSDLSITEAGTTFTVPLGGLSSGSSDAQNVSFDPTGNTVSENVQAAIEELQADIDGIVTTGTNPNDELINTFELNGTSLEITEATVLLPPVDLGGIFATDAEVLAAIAVSDAADGDTESDNEIQVITSTDGSIDINQSGNDYDLSVLGSSDNQNLTSATLVDTDLTISIEDGTSTVADLSALATDAEVLVAIATSEAADGDTEPDNEIQVITSSDGSIDINQSGNDYDLSVLGSSDNQNLTSATLVDTDLTISIEDGTSTVADLSALATDAEVLVAIATSEAADGDTEPDNEIQVITSSDGSIDINQSGNDYDLSVLGSSDNQNLTSATLVDTDLTISIEDGTSTVADLSALATDAEVLVAIAASDAADGDTLVDNEIQTITSLDSSVDITRTGNDYDLSVPTSLDDQIAAEVPVTLDPINYTETAPNVEGHLEGIDAALATMPSLLLNNAVQSDPLRTYDLNGGNLSFIGSGRIGIGASLTNPQSKLDVDGQVQSRGGFASTGGTEGNPGYGFYTNGDTNTGMFRAAADQLAFSTGGVEALRVNANQNVGIGTDSPTERLEVDGNILASGFNTPDYVFEKYFTGTSDLNPEYEFQNLQEVYDFVQKNNHLPGVPSSEAVGKQGGVLVNRATEINLEKIEELFLHTIEQEQKIQSLEAEKEILSREVTELKLRLDRIEKAMTQRQKN